MRSRVSENAAEPPLRAVDADVWVAEAPLRYVVEVGRRMTVVRLGDGGIWIHSPLELSPALGNALDALGRARFITAASPLHGHLALGDYPLRYPDAELLAPPGLAAKRPELTFGAGELGDQADARWVAELDQAVFRGHRLLEEVIFLHRASGSLIVGDTCFNITPSAPVLTRLWAWGPRMRQRAGPALPFRLGVRDRRAARASIDRILAWDFDRVIVGHGEIIESGGHAAFAEAWAWL